MHWLMDMGRVGVRGRRIGRGVVGTLVWEGVVGCGWIPLSLKGELDIEAGAWVGIGWMCFGDTRVGERRYRSFIGDSLQRSQEHTAWILEGWAYHEKKGTGAAAA